MSRRLGVALALSSVLAVAACGSGARESTGVGPGSSSGVPTSARPAASGRLTVFAAASLTESFEDLQASLKTTDPDLSLTYNFGGSGALVTQVQQGAPADVIATADTASMTKLTAAGLVGPPTTFARN